MLFRLPLRLLFTAAILILPRVSITQTTVKHLPLHSAVQDKNFYLLSLLQENPGIRDLLARDKYLKQISAERQDFIDQSLTTCKQNVPCTVKAFLWTEEEIRMVSLALTQIYQDQPSIRSMVDNNLRPSGTYILYRQQPGNQLLADAWEVCARGMNDILSVYGQGADPRYPRIDSISIDINSLDIQKRISTLATETSIETPTSQIFFEPSLKVALALLLLNHRNEAGRLEPMENGVNAAATRTILYTQWAKYPYSVIVVPGAGPTDPDTALSQTGRERTKLAAEAYHAGKAPFILVSGGYVHPSQTRFSEAIEMKEALLEDYNVPETAILVDPHARHTTTNMRNAAREIYRYGLPTDKPALVISDPAQSAYIASQHFADRCLKEMGYLPYEIVDRPSGNSLVFLPKIEALQQDPMDPLDP